MTNEATLAPDVCEYWATQSNPALPAVPADRFHRWLHGDSEENYHRRGNKMFSVESVGYEFNSLGYRGAELEFRPGEKAVMFVAHLSNLGDERVWEHGVEPGNRDVPVRVSRTTRHLRGIDGVRS